MIHCLFWLAELKEKWEMRKGNNQPNLHVIPNALRLRLIADKHKPPKV